MMAMMAKDLLVPSVDACRGDGGVMTVPPVTRWTGATFIPTRRVGVAGITLSIFIHI